MLRIYLPFKKEKESVFKLTDWVSVTKVFFGGNKNFSSAEWTRQERRILRRIWHLHFNYKTHISGSLILSTLSSHFFLFPDRPFWLISMLEWNSIYRQKNWWFFSLFCTFLQNWLAFDSLQRPLFREHNDVSFQNNASPVKNHNFAFCKVIWSFNGVHNKAKSNLC